MFMSMAVSAVGAAVPTAGAETKVAGGFADLTTILLLIIPCMMMATALYGLVTVTWGKRKGTVKTGNSSNWLQKERHTVVSLELAKDAIRKELESVFQEVRGYRPEIPVSDPGEEEIKRLCEAFIARLEEHVEYWNRQPSSTPEP